MPNRILLAEADDVLRASLAEQLQHEGYEVVSVPTAVDAMDAVKHGPYAFAIIGLGEDAGTVLRATGLQAPVLLLVEGEAQTPEALAKPFRFSALLARLHALSSHHAANGDGAVRIGPTPSIPAPSCCRKGRARCG